MGGWGGVIASGLAGAASGMGAAVVDDINERQKAEAQRLRDEQLARLTLQNQQTMARFNADLEVQNTGLKAKAKSDAAYATREQDAAVLKSETQAKEEGTIAGRKNAPITAGGSIYFPETNTWQHGPKPELTQEEKDLKAAQIEELKARARAEGMRAESYRDKVAAGGAGKEGKPAEPHWTVSKDDPNVSSDVRTGIIKTFVPAEPAQPAVDGVVTGWLGKNKPAKAAVPAHFEFSMPNGQPMTMEDYHKVYGKAMDKVSLPEPSTAPEAPPKGSSPSVPASAPALGGSTPPAGAIAKLQANPSMAAAFDAKYGPGASARYLRR